jgi:hypothetical protein
VTEMTDDDVRMMRGRPTESLDDAVSRAFADLAADRRSEPTVYLMPSAACTVPFLN